MTGAPRSGALAQAWVLFEKDLRLEWRARARAVAVIAFGLVSLLLFSFAVGPDSRALEAGAAGFLLLALLLASSLGLAESFRLERERGAIAGLLLLPVEPAALFYGKALANTVSLLALGPALVPAAWILYSVDAGPRQLLTALGLWALAAAGLAAPGTLYAAITSRGQGRDVLLPLLLFPLVVPVLLASVKALGLVLDGDPMGQLGSWTLLLVCFDVIYWSLGGLLFTHAIEEA